MKKSAERFLYDDSTDIARLQLERILQAIVWLGDIVMLPGCARPDPRLSDDDSRVVARWLGDLVDQGFVQRWDIESNVAAMQPRPWWPVGTGTTVIDRETYKELQLRIVEGVDRHRTDLLRGSGRPRGVMLSGVTEFVALREALWTLGLARVLDAESLIASPRRSPSIAAPVQAVLRDRTSTAEISRTFLEFHEIANLSLLRTRDLRRLRRYTKTSRAFVAQISHTVGDLGAMLGDAEYNDLLHDTTIGEDTRLIEQVLNEVLPAKVLPTATSLVASLAGLLVPPLSWVGFAQPLVNWKPHGRERRRLLLFVRRLKRATARSDCR